MEPDFSDNSRSPSPNVLCIDETVCDEEEDESVTVGPNHVPDATVRLDETLNTTVLEIPTLSNLASPSETQLAETQRYNASIITISSGETKSCDSTKRSFVTNRDWAGRCGLNNSNLLLPSNLVLKEEGDDLFETEKMVINGDLLAEFENGQKTAPVSDNDEPVSLETFYTAQDTTPVTGNMKPEPGDVPKIENTSVDGKSLVRVQCSFSLQVNCSVTYSKENGYTVEKQIEKVQVINRSARAIDSLSDFDKRASMSSSGSVYSDKTGLPFPLRPRVSLASVQTSSTSTNEDAPTDPESMFRIQPCQPWKDDCLLGLACDEGVMRNINLGPTKITPVNRVSLANSSLLEKVVNSSIDLNSKVTVTEAVQVPLEPTPKRKRGRPKGSKNHPTITEEGSSPQVVKSTPKRVYRRKNSSTATSTKSSVSDSPNLPGSRKKGPKPDDAIGVAVSPAKKRAVKTPHSSTTSIEALEDSPSGKRGRKLSDNVAGPSGLVSSAKKRIGKQEEKPVAKKFKRTDCIKWNIIPGLDVDQTGTSHFRELRDDISANLGPIPTKPVFKGMKFLLCYVLPPDSKKIRIKQRKSGSNSDYSMSESEDLKLYDRYERIPFNEAYLRKQITAGGGTVFNNFDELPDEDVTCVYLVTNRPNFSAKFLLSLLSKITILHHLHIIEACRSGLMRNMRLQHVGWSKARKKWMEAPRNMHMTLQGKAVHLLNQSFGKGTDESFQQFWTLVLEKLGAKIVTDLNCEYTDIIVTYQPPPKEMEDTLRAIGDMAPTIVSLEWVKESMLYGCPVDRTLHGSFRFSGDSDSSF